MLIWEVHRANQKRDNWSYGEMLTEEVVREIADALYRYDQQNESVLPENTHQASS
jgi:hypothetical protein